MLKTSYADCPGLSPAISVQFAQAIAKTHEAFSCRA